VLTLIATAASVPQLIAGGESLFGRFEATTANLSFATAVAGWMPIGNTAAIMLAAWVLAKKEEGRTEVSQARFDFNLGYLASVVLALCFLIMGAAVLYGAQVETAGGGAQFARVFVDMFAAAVGEWTRTLVAVAALCVMYSTLLAILDGFPRMLQNFLQELGLISSSRAREQIGFRVLLLVVVAAAGTFLLYFLSSFTAFIDLVTITGFLAAPVVAWINYAVITGDNVPLSAQPGRALVIWNYLAIAALLVASGGFLYFRFLA
jgi:hypothetical protein